jgi:outer membrane lipoprotein SlyB
LAGAAIGEHNDRPLAGAAIGTAIGALAGSAIGDSMDQDMEQRAASVARLQGKLTMADVIRLSQSGLGDNVIVRQISRDGVRHPLNAHCVVAGRCQ